MKFKQIEITPNMTEVEQLHARLSNWLTMDAINEYYKEEDLEEYYEYLKEEKAPFNSFTKITQLGSIFYEVETDNGIMYFVECAGFREGVWNFEEVTEETVREVA